MPYNAFKKIRKYGRYLLTKRNGVYKHLVIPEEVRGPILLNTYTEGVQASDSNFLFYKDAYDIKERQTMSFIIETSSVFSLPFKVGKELTYDISVDWGDNVVDVLGKGTTLTESNLTHTYSNSGNYRITITSKSGFIPRFSFLFNNRYNSASKVLEFPTTIINFENDDSLQGFAYNCNKLNSVSKRLLKYNTRTNDARALFSGCTSLEDVPKGLFSNFEDGVVLNVSEAFKDCTGLKTIQPDMFSGLILSDASKLFMGCINLESYINLDTLFNENQSSFSNASMMFKGCSKTTGNAIEFQDRFGLHNLALEGCFNWYGHALVDSILTGLPTEDMNYIVVDSQSSDWLATDDKNILVTE